MVQLFEGAAKNWRFVLKFVVLALVFWLLEFVYQFFINEPGEFAFAWVRGFGFAGATFISAALFSSAVFKWKPVWAKYWYVRRSFGVLGFVFIVFHVWGAINLYYKGNLNALFFSWNPFENPLIFGFIAFPIFGIMALTSTDWAAHKLKTKWKALHRLVYFAFYASVFHFLTINPPQLLSPPGYLLLALTFLALAGELFWFFKTVSKRNFSTLGTLIGILIIFLYLITAYLKWFAGA